MNNKQLKQTIIEKYIKAYNKFDVAGMLEGLHKEVIFENISNDEITLSTNGIEQFRKQAESAIELFSQREQRIISLQFNNDKVEAEIDYRGVLAKDLPNGLKSGETLKLKGKSIFYFDNNEKINKIVDIS